MSDAYNSLLSTKDVWKGKCGNPELFDKKEEQIQKAHLLALWIKKCSNLVIFTGAGISTSSGIPDFRGPNGIWTKEEQLKKQQKKKLKQEIKPEEEEIKCKKFEEALPSYSHMSICALEQRGVLQLLISQNVDGLHMFSGIPRDKLAELHGNVFLELCSSCGGEEVRDAPSGSVGLRTTGRKCKYCIDGDMHDCTLDWNDELPESSFVKSTEELKKSDLVICMGSSLQVRPAAELPLLVKNNFKEEAGVNQLSCGKLVIINLQTTPADKHADLIIRGYVDDIMRIVMKKLMIEVPSPQRLTADELNEIFVYKTNPENVERISFKLSEQNKNNNNNNSDEGEQLDVSEFDDEWKPSKRKRKSQPKLRKRRKL